MSKISLFPLFSLENWVESVEVGRGEMVRVVEPHVLVHAID
jgi:hypothetical protein